MARNSGAAESGSPDGVVVKKYANRRLYNTSTSSYVTLQDLAGLVREDVEFVVRDARSGEDITRSVLTQIIAEQETKGSHLLPLSVLRQLIGYYGDSLEELVPRYLETAMQSFASNQDRMRDYLENALGGMYAFPQLEELGRQNMSFFKQAMEMMTPFPPAAGEEAPPPEAGAKTADGPAEALDELRSQLAAMQKQIDSLADAAGGKT